MGKFGLLQEVCCRLFDRCKLQVSLMLFDATGGRFEDILASCAPRHVGLDTKDGPPPH